MATVGVMGLKVKRYRSIYLPYDTGERAPPNPSQ